MAELNDLLGDNGSLKIPELSGSIGGMPNKVLMADARSDLNGNWGLSVLGYLLYMVFVGSFYCFVFTSAFFVGMVGGVCGSDVGVAGRAMLKVVQFAEVFLSGAFAVGFCSFFLGIAQEGEARLELLFTGFKRFWTAFGAYFISTLFIFLWSLLLIVPGIIAIFRYAMVYFIVADDADCGALEAIRRSKEIMAGNKWKFFCLNWRFFWWAILCNLTLGIGYIWLVPYMQTTFAKFYEDIK